MNVYKEALKPLEDFKLYHSDANYILVKYPIELKDEITSLFSLKNLLGWDKV